MALKKCHQLSAQHLAIQTVHNFYDRQSFVAPFILIIYLSIYSKELAFSDCRLFILNEKLRIRTVSVMIIIIIIIIEDDEPRRSLFIPFEFQPPIDNYIFISKWEILLEFIAPINFVTSKFLLIRFIKLFLIRINWYFECGTRAHVQ